MKGLVLAGGLGTRMRPLTHTGPKQLIPVANKPVLFYGIEDLVNAGIREIGMIVGYTEDRIKSIRDAVGDGSRWGCRISYIEQDAPRGLAHAVWTAKDFLGNDKFVVYLGDNMIKGGIAHFVQDFEKSGADANILLAEVPDARKFGVAVLKGDEVVEVEEKPKQPKSNYAITGIYMFNHRIFSIIETLNPSGRGELELTHALDRLIKSPDHKITAHVVEGWWDDAGSFEDILHANHLVLNDMETKIDGKIEEGATVIGNIQLGEGSVVEKGAFIRGPAIIGKHCTISTGTYIGPYTAIGSSSTIKSGEIESSIIMDGSFIDIGGDKIVDSLVGKGSNIVLHNGLPKGRRFVLGENSEVKL
ncbi:MAG: glucose-1-phosphate thymidylyltransferase [Candidatus Aenigmarchaeota archaeon]|nr:glucose-1-phosphate thymidylyltransferase [Candidatus Aenigmarchaeota archaeon]